MKTNILKINQLREHSKPIADRFCIYVLLKDENVVYVGSTGCGIGRIRWHIGSKDFDSYVTVPCCQEEMLALETLYIIEYMPIYNEKWRFPCMKTARAMLGEKIEPNPSKGIKRVHCS